MIGTSGGDKKKERYRKKRDNANAYERGSTKDVIHSQRPVGHHLQIGGVGNGRTADRRKNGKNRGRGFATAVICGGGCWGAAEDTANGNI